MYKVMSLTPPRGNISAEAHHEHHLHPIDLTLRSSSGDTLPRNRTTIMAAAAPARRAFRPPPSSTAPLLDPTHQAGLTSLLSQTYNKPVSLKLSPLTHRHHDSDLLAQTAVQQLRDRRNQPRRIIRDAAWKSPLPTQAAVRRLQQERQLRENMRKPITLARLNEGGVAGTQTSEILRDLNLSQVSSVSVEAAGRLTKRISANRAQSKVARRGATAKGQEHLVKGWQKKSVTNAIRSGKRRIGQYGISVQLGHS